VKVAGDPSDSASPASNNASLSLFVREAVGTLGTRTRNLLRGMPESLSSVTPLFFTRRNRTSFQAPTPLDVARVTQDREVECTTHHTPLFHATPFLKPPFSLVIVHRHPSNTLSQKGYLPLSSTSGTFLTALRNSAGTVPWNTTRQRSTYCLHPRHSESLSTGYRHRLSNTSGKSSGSRWNPACDPCETVSVEAE
jgi:hypothetical protein